MSEALHLEEKFAETTTGFLEDGICAGMRLPLPRLGGEHEARIFNSARSADEAHGFRLFNDGDLLIGYGVERVRDGLEQTALRLYRRLIAAAAGKSLCRIWNYVPDINEPAGGLEGYHAFSSGRAGAFEEAFGPGYRSALCAASAVGFHGQALMLAFAAGGPAPRHFENPEQVPAYHYPLEHGPRPPSFSRATSTVHDDRPLIFISGTAAIKGHQTVAPGTLDPQLDCTLDNLRLIFEVVGAGRLQDESREFDRHFKVYLRCAEDLAKANERLQASLFRSGDHVTWLRADLCRAALTVEIEATLVGRG